MERHGPDRINSEKGMLLHKRGTDTVSDKELEGTWAPAQLLGMLGRSGTPRT